MTVATREQHTKWKETNPLRTYRARHGHSLMTTAAMLSSSVSAIQQWESGASTPTPDKMAVIADMLGVDVDTLDERWRRWAKRHP